MFFYLYHTKFFPKLQISFELAIVCLWKFRVTAPKYIANNPQKYLCMMKRFPYFSTVSDPCVTGRCLHLLLDILLIGLCTYLTGGMDYKDMHLFALERAPLLGDMLSLPHGTPSKDTLRRVFERVNPIESEFCLSNIHIERLI